MNVIDTIASRRTIGRLVDPAPDESVLAQAFQAAVAAPDHKRMRPWRFLVIEGEARKALGALLAGALKKRKPEASDVDLAREADKPLRAPMLIAAIAKVKPDAGIPEIEQLLAAGAATQNLMLALHAQGFGSAWKTGAGCYDPIVKTGLGLAASDQLIGLVYVGSISAAPLALAAPDYRDYVSAWSGSSA